MLADDIRGNFVLTEVQLSSYKPQVRVGIDAIGTYISANNPNH